jgi:putative transposase
LQGYDYSSNGAYFITICTKNREHFFGEIVETENIASQYKMQLSEIGKITNDCWKQIPKHFPFVKLGEFIVMPNHMHGIVIIDKNNDINYGDRDAINRVSTIHRVSTGGITKQNNPMLYKNLSTIIRWYKGRTTFETRKINPNFVWQPRFHDHIIRNEEEFKKISEYILYNPFNWQTDDHFLNNLRILL